MATQCRTSQLSDNEVSILARFLANGNGPIPETMARYLLDLTINKQDKTQMHELTVRNQDDDLTSVEKEEMHAFGRAPTVVSILKSKARRTLGVKRKTFSVSYSVIKRIQS
jgi:hypothetical protein